MPGTRDARSQIERMTIPALITVFGIGLISVGCSSPPTIAAYNNQANGICRTYAPGLKSVETTIALLRSSNESHLESGLSTALAQAEQGSAQLEALAQPDGEGAALRRAFSSANAQIVDLKSLASALQSRTESKIQLSEKAIGESEAPLNQQFDMLGLTDCGSGSTPSSRGTG